MKTPAALAAALSHAQQNVTVVFTDERRWRDDDAETEVESSECVVL